MRTRLMLAGLAVGLVLLALWLTGSLDAVADHAAAAQKDTQNALARALRALRAGEPGALASLIGIAFGYGVFHAVGPGHGKVLIGGYGVARRVRLLPLAGIAVASSLAQATSAVGLVYAGVLVLNLSRERMVDLTERVFAPASYAAIGLIGLWLALRGGRRLVRGLAAGRVGGVASGPERAGQAAIPHGAPHGHTHDHADDRSHVHDASCGHRHGPTVEEVASVASIRDAAVLVAGIAVRPCTGALFLLILCWRMRIDAVGIAGAYAMGLGTAVVTVAVAGLSVWTREGAFAAVSGSRLVRALPLVEVAAGLAVAAVAVEMLRHAI